MAKQERPKERSKDRPKDRPKQGANAELMEKVLFINRCSKTTSGGKKMSFSALILVGDAKGHVGYGFAKANELTDAIRKGGEIARKNLQTVVMEGTTIPHDVNVKWDGASVLMRPAPPGTGVVAGSKVRAILEFAGFKDVMAKSFGNNPINLVRATFKALLSMTTRENVMKSREAV
ncbi:MAG: ribosomal protein [Chlamydiia bacterium]|nr:ribosomal protein [Chlamydiia bacterium]